MPQNTPQLPPNTQVVTTDIYPPSGATQTEAIKIKAIANTNPETSVEIEYTNVRFVGNGSFGSVFIAHLTDGSGPIAIKKVLQDKRYKNRELQIMLKLEHLNVIKLRYYFYHTVRSSEQLFLNLVLDYMPNTLFRLLHLYQKNRKQIPPILIRLYSYQMFRAVGYIHSAGVCHRDIKPQNLLINETNGTLKLCDFGSAKFLVPGETNVSYICSRYYRAPELIFGSTNYTNKVDVWSCGTVLAELMLDRPIFPGESGVDQLVEIIKLLGTPTQDQIHKMNSNYRELLFPSIRPRPWPEIFPQNTLDDAIDLVAKLLEYDPEKRLTSLQACTHKFFDELRLSDTRLPNGNPLPLLFNFTDEELAIEPSLNSILIKEEKPSSDNLTENKSINDDSSSDDESDSNIGSKSESFTIISTETKVDSDLTDSKSSDTTI